jgi:hypothetical protein
MPILFAKEISELVTQEAYLVFAGGHWVFDREQLISLPDNPSNAFPA